MHPWARTQAGIFVLLFFSAAYFLHIVEYDNSGSRFFLLSAVVDYGRLEIDMYKDRTIDISVSGDRIYSNKAIGAPLVAVPVYWVLRHWTPMRHDGPLSQRAQYFTRLVTTTLPHALLGVVLFRFLLAIGVGPMRAYLTVLAYAFGTISWIHASMFSGHQMAASFAFFSFVSVWSLGGRRLPDAPSRPGLWLGAGLLAGLGALADYTAIFLAGILALYAFFKSNRPVEWLSFLFGGAIAAAALLAYNTRCFGNPFSFSYAHLGYQEFAEGSRQGILGVAMPNLEALASLILSPARGLFFIMPVLLLSLPGIWVWWRAQHARAKAADVRDIGTCGVSDTDPEWNKEALVVAVAAAGYFLINAGFYGWHGGWTFGPRYLVPILPFFVIPMAFAMDWVWFSAFFVIGFAQIACAQFGLPHTPEYFANPIVECIYPLFRYGYAADNAGLRMGLGWSHSVVLWLAVCLSIGVLARPKEPEPVENYKIPYEIRQAWRPVYLIACLAIMVGLAVVRTQSSPPALLHEFKSKLLGNLAYELSSEPLARAAYREERLAKRGSRPQ